MVTLADQISQEMKSATLEDLFALDRQIAAREQVLGEMKHRRSQMFQSVQKQRLDAEAATREREALQLECDDPDRFEAAH
jgi:hypothetical protein